MRSPPGCSSRGKSKKGLPATRPRRAVGRARLIVRVRIPISVGGRDPPREHEMSREPTAAVPIAENVIAHAVPGGRRVNDAIVAHVDGDVIDVLAVVREEE